MILDERILLGAFLSAFLATSGVDGSERSLQTSNKLSWPECVNQKLSGEDCKTLIEAEVEDHHIPELNVKISTPRTPTELEETYNKVEIMTNMFGKVTGTVDDGLIYYPFDWEGSDPILGTRSVGPWDCTFTDAADCCDKIREEVPDPDIHGRYIDCFITEKGLEPKNNVNGGIDYYAFIYDTFQYKYVFQLLDSATLEESELCAVTYLKNDIVQINQILDAQEVLYEDLHALERALQAHTRAIGTAQNLISELFLARINSAGVNGTVIPVDEGSALADALFNIKHYSLKYMRSSKTPRSTITVRLDTEGFVVKTPRVGAVEYFIDSTELLSGADFSGPSGMAGGPDGVSPGGAVDDPFAGMLGGGPGGFPNGGGFLPPEGVNVAIPTFRYCGNVLEETGLQCFFKFPCETNEDCNGEVAFGPAPYCLSECGPNV